MRSACLATCWAAVAVALVFICLSFSVGVQITVWTATLGAGLPVLACWVWVYALEDSPMQELAKDKARRPVTVQPSELRVVSRPLSPRQKYVTLVLAVVVGLSCETAMVGLAHGRSIEEDGNFFRCTLKGCHHRVPIGEAEYWQLQAYQIRLFSSWFTVFAGLPIIAFARQKERQRADGQAAVRQEQRS